MKIFDLMKQNITNELLFLEENMVSLKAIIAIDNTVLGPAMGNCRLFNYKKEEDAIYDAINMAHYNTYRSALLRRNLGGGSIVLLGNPKAVKSEMYFRALGIMINKLNGKILLSKGAGLNQPDLADIRRETNYVLGINEQYGGLGDTASNEAAGVIFGLKAAVKEILDRSSLDGLKVAVQGIGEIGNNLVRGLLKEKAVITVTDLVYDKIKVIQDEVPQIKVVKPDDIYSEKCDIFLSCAYDGLIDEKNASKLSCKILSGCVNTSISSAAVKKVLDEKKIVYVPGFLINTGDIIQLTNEREGFDISKTEREIGEIYYLAQSIIRKALNEKKYIDEIALNVAKEYIANVASIKMIK